jgi:hypothetical protein
LEPELKSRSTMLSKILGPETAHTFDNDDAPDALRDTRPALPTPMLDLVMRTGHIESFGYAYLSRVSFDPKGRLLLFFGEDIAVLEGRNLEDIRQKVRTHRANEIFEGTEAEEALKPESSAHVERIHVTTKEELEEESHDRGSGKGIVRQ